MKHKYVIGLDGSGLDELATGIEEYAKWIVDRANTLLQKLADYGLTIANAGFDSAVYDGTNDFSVDFEERGNNIKAIVAVGATVLFVEFGTGVTYPDNHPEAAKHGMVRGGYGKGKGKSPTWGYYGDPGSNGYIHINERGESVVLTHGNPANMPMYNAVKQIEEDFKELALGVFSD